MPMVNADLQVTKNEISLQVFQSKNSGRAGKVLNGASTDMEDMMNLCNYYHIDICQFMLFKDGTHPVLLHRSELDRLKKAAKGEDDAEVEDVPMETLDDEPAGEADGTGSKWPSGETDGTGVGDMRYLNDKNVGQLIECLAAKDAKIAELYERIVQVSEENARLKAKLTSNNYLLRDMVADESGQR